MQCFLKKIFRNEDSNAQRHNNAHLKGRLHISLGEECALVRYQKEQKDVTKLLYIYTIY